MKKATDQDALMIRYLLGDATEEEQLRLEEQFFTDDEGYQQLLAIEDELRYEYAQGGLTSRQRKSFEKRFLVSAGDRQRVELAKTVLSAMPPVVKESRPWWRSVADFLVPQPGMRLSFASAALALIVVVGGSWFTVQTARLRNQVAQLQAKQKSKEAQLQVASEGARSQLAKQLDQERSRREELEKQLANRSLTVFSSFILTPGLVRDADGQKRLIIPADANEVRLQLDVKSKGVFKSYRAELQNLDGESLWSQNVTQAAVTLPGRLLKPGDYVLSLKGISDSGEAVELGEFYFQAIRK